MGPRTYTPIDALEGHPVLHMQLEPWVSPCALFVWLLIPWELWGFWLGDIVLLPMGLQTPSVPSCLSLTPSLGNQCSIQGLSMSTHVCVFQALEEFLRRQLHSGSSQQAFLGIFNSVCVWWLYMEWIPILDSLWAACPSLCAPHFVSHDYFVTPFRKDWSIHTLVFLLEHHFVCELVLGYCEILDYYPHISESNPCVYIFWLGYISQHDIF